MSSRGHTDLSLSGVNIVSSFCESVTSVFLEICRWNDLTLSVSNDGADDVDKSPFVKLSD